MIHLWLNGKEKDNEDEWGNTAYDYGFRIYNPEIGKFLSVDPLTRNYSMLTPYRFASNAPIIAVDLDGLEAYVTIQQKNKEGGYDQKFTTIMHPDTEQADIHNARKEFPKAFEKINDIDGVNILVDEHWNYIGVQVVPGVSYEQDRWDIWDAANGYFGPWIEDKFEPIYDFGRSLKETEMGVEIKGGIEALNVSFKTGAYSTMVSNAGYFAETSLNGDLSNGTILTLNALKPILKGEFYLLLKTSKSSAGSDVKDGSTMYNPSATRNSTSSYQTTGRNTNLTKSFGDVCLGRIHL